MTSKKQPKELQKAKEYFDFGPYEVPLEHRLRSNPLKVLEELGLGYETLTDLALNDGRPDKFVESNLFDRFSDYQFTANDLEQFTGFVIKIVMISTNESFPVTLKDFRALALA